MERERNSKKEGDCGKEDEVWDHERKAIEGFQKK